MTKDADINRAATLNSTLCKNTSIPIIQVIIYFVQKDYFALFGSISTPIRGHRAARDVIVQRFNQGRVIN